MNLDSSRPYDSPVIATGWSCSKQGYTIDDLQVFQSDVFNESAIETGYILLA